MQLLFYITIACFGADLFLVLSFAFRYATIRSFESLGEGPLGEERLPAMSLVVTARNEAQSLPDTVSCLFAQDLPDLEVIVVNDRSTDESAELLTRLAAEHPRLEVVTVKTLPDGWLGKVNAMAQGLKVSKGKYVAFADGDALFAPHVFQRTLAHMVTKKLDHFSVIPKVPISSFFHEELLFATVSLILFKFGGRALGTGALSVVRREALEGAGGIGALKMEVVDDVGLATLMVRAGFQSACFASAGDVTYHWHGSFKALVGGLHHVGMAGET